MSEPLTSHGVIRGHVLRCEFNFVVPKTAKTKQLREWVAYNLGYGCIDLDNPLLEESLEAVGAPALHDVGVYSDRFDRRDAEIAKSISALAKENGDPPVPESKLANPEESAVSDVRTSLAQAVKANANG